MKTLPKLEMHLETFTIKKEIHQITEKVVDSKKVIDFKFYQKLIVVLISFFTILIIPESPKELEIVCNNNYSKQTCNVW